jgi:hypothetical protein
MEKIKQIIQTTKDKYKEIDNKGLIWDVIKTEIRGATISYSAFRNKERRSMQEELTKELTELDKKLDQNGDKDLMDQKTLVKKQLEEINNYETKGAYIRANTQYVEFNEKSTKLFLGIGKSKGKIKNITALRIDDKKTITKPDEILKEENRYYENLYKEPKNIENTEKQEAKNYFLKNCNLQKVTEDDKSKLENVVSDYEISNALKGLSSNKCPGSDGFSAEFYKFFWIDIKELVCDSIKYAFKTGALSIEQKRGVLNLVPKKDKDIRYLKNWRPITLLNVDYKILAKIMANRIQKVIPYIINNDQSGCIKEDQLLTISDLR